MKRSPSRELVGRAAPAQPRGVVLPSPAVDEPAVDGLDLAPFRERELPTVAPGPVPSERGELLLDGYRVVFGDDGEVVIHDPKGKRLKGVPEKVRKREEYQAVMRGRKDDRSRIRHARTALETRMIEGRPFAADHLAWLVADDAYGLLLRSLVIAAVDEPTPVLLLTWDEERGLGVLPPDHDARWIGWQDVEILHPLRLGDVARWQDLILELGRKQELVQVFREIKSVPVAHLGDTESACLAGRQTRSAAAIEAVLMDLGWVARRGSAHKIWRLSMGDGRMAAFEAWFDYGDGTLPTEPTTTGNVGFLLSESRAALHLWEVPRIVVSETLRSLEFACARVGASGEMDDAEEMPASEDANQGSA